MCSSKARELRCVVALAFLVLSGCSPATTASAPPADTTDSTMPYPHEPVSSFTGTASVEEPTSVETPIAATALPPSENVAKAATSVEKLVRALDTGLVRPDAVLPDDALLLQSETAQYLADVSQMTHAWSVGDYESANLLAASILERLPPLPSIMDGDRLEGLTQHCSDCTILHVNGNALVRVRGGTWSATADRSNWSDFTLTARFMPLFHGPYGQGGLTFDVGTTLSVGSVVISPPGTPADPSRYGAIAFNNTPFDYLTMLCDFGRPQENQWTQMTLRMRGATFEVSLDTGTVCKAEAFLLEQGSPVAVNGGGILLDFIQIVWLPRAP